ncbi:hypothetical protein [Thalassoglobus sp.]|uniref:hypothetical protein n=1 Tax=Thalassoglobus sp. TaxID=2795869 RepID=UPI003AA97000
MTTLRTLALAAILMSVGYLLGQANVGANFVNAQQVGENVPEETVEKIRAANRNLNEAMEALKSAGLYESVTEGPNAFLILSGGGSARQDLESGRGVDPETFAGLYAGRAIPEIQDLIGKDEQNRLTYNDEVIRIYSKSRLQRVLANRTKLTEVNF